MGEDYISLKDASALTPYSQEYLSLLARRGKINAKKVGRIWHIEKGEILEYYRTHKEDIVRFGNASRKAGDTAYNSRYPETFADRILRGRRLGILGKLGIGLIGAVFMVTFSFSLGAYAQAGENSGILKRFLSDVNIRYALNI